MRKLINRIKDFGKAKATAVAVLLATAPVLNGSIASASTVSPVTFKPTPISGLSGPIGTLINDATWLAMMAGGLAFVVGLAWVALSHSGNSSSGIKHGKEAAVGGCLVAVFATLATQIFALPFTL